MAHRLFKILLITIMVSALSWGFSLHLNVVDTMLSRFAYPVVIVQHVCTNSLKKMQDFFRTRKELRRLCDQYQTQHEELVKENIELSGLLDTWRSIEELVEFKKRYDGCGVITQIIFKQFSPQAHFFLIDGGHNRGITTNMLAVYKNCLLGRVTEVYPSYSKVKLITDPACKVAALCQQSRDEGMHEGCGTLDSTKIKLKMTQLSDNKLNLQKRLKKGDLVLSSGQGKVFPKGFGLGMVRDFNQEDFQHTLVLEPLVDFQALDYCLVLAKGAEYNTTDRSKETVIKASLQNEPPVVMAQPVSSTSPSAS